MILKDWNWLDYLFIHDGIQFHESINLVWHKSMHVDEYVSFVKLMQEASNMVRWKLEEMWLNKIWCSYSIVFFRKRKDSNYRTGERKGKGRDKPVIEWRLLLLFGTKPGGLDLLFLQWISVAPQILLNSLHMYLKISAHSTHC